MFSISHRTKALVSAAVGLLFLSACHLHRSASTARSLPHSLEMSLHEQFEFHPKQLKGGSSYHFISGNNGEVWVILQESLRPLMAAPLSEGLTPSFQVISPCGWNHVERVSVTNDEHGNPVVIMMGKPASQTGTSLYEIETHVVVRKYYDNMWSEPVQLDLFRGFASPTPLSLLDSRGHIHLIYNRPLSPREEYGIGHGYFPDKCFHAWFDGVEWHTALATTGRGEFYVTPLFLSELPDTRICLGIRILPFSLIGYMDEYNACQTWDGRRWTSLAKEIPSEALSVISAVKQTGACSERILADSSISTAISYKFRSSFPCAIKQPVYDYWGNRFSITEKDDAVVCVHEKRESDSVEIIPLLNEAIISRERDGRIIVCSWNSAQALVRIWNGSNWDGVLNYPLDLDVQVTQILSNPDGNIFMVHKGNDRIVIQRITLR